MNNIDANRDAQGRFVKGWRGGPGRPRGSRDRNPRIINPRIIPLADLAAVFEKIGAAALAKLRPKDFLRLVLAAIKMEEWLARMAPVDQVREPELPEKTDADRRREAEEWRARMALDRRRAEAKAASAAPATAGREGRGDQRMFEARTSTKPATAAPESHGEPRDGGQERRAAARDGAPRPAIAPLSPLVPYLRGGPGA